MVIFKTLDGITKVCPKCGTVAIKGPAIKKTFGFDRRQMDGLQTYCRSCRSKRYFARKEEVEMDRVMEEARESGYV